MAIGPRLDLRQSQSLVMTPQLQQAIRLLALSNLEIESFIAEELEKNPLLEIGDGGEPAISQDMPAEPMDSIAIRETAGSDELIAGGQGESDAPLDMNAQEDIFHHDCASDRVDDKVTDGASTGQDGMLALNDVAGSLGDGGGDFEDRLADDVSLRDHLLSQAGASLSGVALFIARQLIEHIDETGYCRANLLEIAQGLGLPLFEVEAALVAVQAFDPCGVGARSLSECLVLQAKEADRYDPAMARLLDNLELLARGALPQLKRICGVDDEDMADMIAELRQYDPKPGLRFGGGVIEAIVPDIFVVERRTGWAIEINSASLPRVLLNRSYYVELSGGSHDKASKAWLSECLADANWLIKALDQRQRTIIKVASEIVKQQEGFFRHGVSQLRPLTLKNVAEAIDMHESTVSRVTSHKYLNCARGNYELKFFFTSSIQSADGGEAVSAEAVKSHIKSLIDGESAAKILSDDTLVDLLNAKGFDIARRTVAKYREAIGLGSSVQRRRQKKLAGER